MKDGVLSPDEEQHRAVTMAKIAGIKATGSRAELCLVIDCLVEAGDRASADGTYLRERVKDLEDQLAEARK